MDLCQIKLSSLDDLSEVLDFPTEPSGCLGGLVFSLFQSVYLITLRCTNSYLNLFCNRKFDTRSAGCNQLEQRKGYHRHQSGHAATQQPFSRGEESMLEGVHVAQSDPTMQTTASALITGKQYSSKDYEEIIRDLKRLNAKQASEVRWNGLVINGVYWFFL